MKLLRMRRRPGPDSPAVPLAHPRSTTDPSQDAGSPVVEVYWRPGCPFCSSLLGALRASGVPLREVDIWDDPAAAARVRAVADGNETVPTVFVAGQAMVNPSVERVLAAQLDEIVAESAR